MSRRVRMFLFAAIGGALVAACWLPFGLAPLLPIPLFILLRGLRLTRSLREAALFGLVMGTAVHAVGGHYILALVSFSPLAVAIWLLDIAYAIPFAVAETTAAFWIERKTGLSRSIGMTLVYCLMEWVRTLGDLSVPSDLLAHCFGTNPQWLAWTPWTGPYFIALLGWSTAAALDAALESRVHRPRRAAAIATLAVIVWMAPPATDLVIPAKADDSARAMRVGIVQPSVSVHDKLDREQWPRTRSLLVSLTRRAAAGAELVVWPESARPGPVIWREGEPLSDPPMEALAREVGVPILYGCEIAVLRDGQVMRLYNAAMLVHPDGRPADWYGKQQLLPFVEGVPFADWIGWDPAEAHRDRKGKRSYLTLLGNFRRGPRLTIFEVGSARIGVLICYEGLYPQLVRRYLRSGANALCVMTNDAWWGRTVFPEFHARMIATRAREAGVPVVRAANSGVSSSTDRRGRMGPSTGLFEVTTLRVSLEPSTTGATFYARTGDLLIWALMIAVGSLVVLGSMKR